jgi:hypothetical protein
MNTKEQETPSHTSLWFFYTVRQAWRVKRDTLHRQARTIVKDKASTPICPRCGNDINGTLIQEPYPN